MLQNSSSHFGDFRLDRAADILHERLVTGGPRGISIRGVGGNRATEVRFGRFLRNGKVTEEKLIEKARKDTSSRVDGLHILAIQDTTTFRDDGLGNSVSGHATIALEAEVGALLGVVDLQLLEHFGGDRKPPKNRPLRKKESYRWVEGMLTSAAALNGAAMVTVVADREADIFEMFACHPEGVEVLIRASHDRHLADDTCRLFASLDGKPWQEHIVELPARPGHKKREARIGVRFGGVSLKRPRDRGSEPDVPDCQPVSLVEAWEIDPPEGMQPVHWRLLTSHRIETFEQARWIIQLYRQRWVYWGTVMRQPFALVMLPS